MRHFLGIQDSEFIRGKIPMTKSEIRILALAKARIAEDDIIVDVGAGTGSLSIEAALLAPYGKVYSIEREPEGIDLIQANSKKFAVPNLTAIAGSAPEALSGLPSCDVVFIGGSGGKLDQIIHSCDQLLKPNGRMIITAVTIETLFQALKLMQSKSHYEVEAFSAQIARINQIASYNMLQALNPINIIACSKGGQYA
jgi:precorrin-6Y C5,15-methyltransferase (decarboxylating) CbiT subunit